jgi:4-amino-4-deoxy-L-arabinose transferase-like glycosyltransferase
MIFVVARRWGRTVAWTSVVLLALSPYAIRYGTEARMYSLVMLLVLGGWYCLRRALDQTSNWWIVASGVVAVLLLYTHYWSLYLLFSTAVVLAVIGWRTPPLRRVISRLFAAGVAAGVLYLPWLPSMVEQARHTGTPWGGRVRPTVMLAQTINELGGFVADGEAVGVMLVLLVIFGVFGRSSGPQKVELDLRAKGAMGPEAAIVVLTMAVAAGALAATNSAYASRYAAVVVPFVIVMAALGVHHLGTPRTKVCAAALVAVLGVPGIVANLRVDRTQGTAAATLINAQAAPGDLVVYCPDQLGPAGSRALRADLQAFRYPDLGDPRFVDWRDYAARNAVTKPADVGATLLSIAGSRTIWLVWNGGYRTLSDQCEQLGTAFAATRKPVVIMLPSKAFEPANLYRYSPS